MLASDNTFIIFGKLEKIYIHIKYLLILFELQTTRQPLNIMSL